MTKIILGSASPRRMELLRELGAGFEVVPSAAEELHDPKIAAAQLCETNAERKAAEVASRYPDRIVLGADTLVTLEGKLYGKPRDLIEAAQMLGELAGRRHEVITGVCLIGPTAKTKFHEATEVEFKPLTLAEIAAYLAAVPVLDKAGAYGIQERGEMLVKSISGSFSNVMGLPIERLAMEFDRWQIPYNKRNR